MFIQWNGMEQKRKSNALHTVKVRSKSYFLKFLFSVSVLWVTKIGQPVI